MRQSSPFSERIERAVIAVICLDLVLQTAETVDAMARAAKLATRTNAVIKLARAFRFAMDEAGVLFVGTCIVVFTAGDGERAV